MNEEIAEYYEELYNLCAVEQEQPLARRYRQLREALERVMRQQMMGTGCPYQLCGDSICIGWPGAEPIAYIPPDFE